MFLAYYLWGNIITQWSPKICSPRYPGRYLYLCCTWTSGNYIVSKCKLQFPLPKLHFLFFVLRKKLWWIRSWSWSWCKISSSSLYDYGELIQEGLTLGVRFWTEPFSRSCFMAIHNKLWWVKLLFYIYTEKKNGLTFPALMCYRFSLSVGSWKERFSQAQSLAQIEKYPFKATGLAWF